MLMKLVTSGSFKRTFQFLNKITGDEPYKAMDEFGRKGVAALASATPVESGLTASSWTYDIERNWGKFTIRWSNTNIHNGVNVAIILQYGHGTGTGGFVAGRDYINPAIQPIFDEIANSVWKEVMAS